MAPPASGRASVRTPGALPRSIFRLEVRAATHLRLRAVGNSRLPRARPYPEQIDLAAHAVDAALWCTVSIQAWKESERVAWSQLPARAALLRASGRNPRRSPVGRGQDRDKLFVAAAPRMRLHVPRHDPGRNG